MNRRRERGFTLIELMVALVVSSLLVGMILAIFSRMSLAYRGQQQIAGVQQVLAAARGAIELDARQAGFAMAQGFRIAADQPPLPASPVVVRSPVRVVNSATGPDQIAFYYADPSAQAVVTGVGVWATTPTVTVDSTAGFLPGDLVVLSTADPSLPNPIPSADPSTPPANLVTYDACVLRIAPAGVAGTIGGSLTFETVLPWGLPDSRHCTTPTPMPPPPGTKQAAMVYKFMAHAYRIDPDPARAATGALQGSLVSGGLLGTAADNWTDLAYGFTDIQTALQVFDGDGVDTPDPDSDGNREWYSGDMQRTLTEFPTLPISPASLLQISISLVARTDRDVEGVATTATPQLIDPAIPDNNTVGDHPSVPLPSPTDPALQGARIYRSTTFQVDFRNLGVGR